MNPLLFTRVMLAAVAVMTAIALLFLNYLATEPKATPLSDGCAGEPIIQALRVCLRRIRQQKTINEEVYVAYLRRLLAVQSALERGKSRERSKRWSSISAESEIRLESR